MTRRERLEAKLEKREEWAGKAKARADARFETARKMADIIPLGQPLLVDHHSYKRDRAYRGRIAGNMDKGVEQAKLADHHVSKAAGLERQLEGSIFSDDPDAVEALEAKVAALEAERAACRAVNAAWRKAKRPKADDVAGWTRVAEILGCTLDDLKEARLNQAHDFLDRGPYPTYVLSNLGGRITAAKKRVDLVKVRRERTEAAEASTSGVAVEDRGHGYVSVTFAEKPAREVLTALKAAGFWWQQGCWSGQTERLPACVANMVGKPEPIQVGPERPGQEFEVGGSVITTTLRDVYPTERCEDPTCPDRAVDVFGDQA